MKSLTDIPSEYKCHQNFYRMVWGDLTCKECGNKGLLFRKTYEYCPYCKKKYSVKADTSLFKFCNLSFRQIYALIWCWQHKCSIGEIRNILGLSYPTVSNWLRKLRSHLPVSREILDGTCEVDGSFFGRRKFRSQRLVISAINQKTKQVRLKIVKYRTRAEAEKFIQNTIKTGSLVLTDGFKGYNELPLLGYKWRACDHSIGFFGPTNHIENLWSVIKRALRYIYRDLTFNLNDLELILREWENRHNNPDLFYNEDNYLKTACSELFN